MLSPWSLGAASEEIDKSCLERRNANLICLWVWGIQHLRDWALIGASLNFQPVTDFCLEVKFCPWLGLEAALPSVCKVLRVRGRMEEKSLHIPLIKYLLYSCQEFCLKAKSDGLKECKHSAFSLAAVVAYGLFFWEPNTAWLCPSGFGRALSKPKMGTPFVTMNSHNS